MTPVPSSLNGKTDHFLRYPSEPQAFQEITSQIYSSRNLNDVLVVLQDRLISLFHADRITVYVVNLATKEIYSRFKVGDEISEIRLPISDTSLAGYVAKTGRSLNIRNAYDEKEIGAINPNLRFDESWDEKTGYRTKQMLIVPVCFHGFTLGVLQLINKIDGNYFAREDEESAAQIAKALGMALYNQHRSFLYDRRSGTERRLFDETIHSGPERRSGGDRRQNRDRRERDRTKYDYLVENLLVTEEKLLGATLEARNKGIDVERVLTDHYMVNKNDLGMALSHFYQTKYIPFTDSIPIPGDLLHNLKPSFLRSNCWVPLERKNGVITVLIDDPHHLIKQDSARSLLKTENVEFCVGLREDILGFLDYFYGSPLEQSSFNNILDATEGEEDQITEEEFVTETDGIIVQFVNKMINDACKKRASDIHIESYPGKHKAEIRFRIDGECIPYQTIPYHHKRGVVSRLKVMADMDISERRLPQDGKMRFRKHRGEELELRVATLPMAGGVEDVSLRILNSGGRISIKELGFSEANLRLFKEFIQMPYGMVLVVGPTGSGKTTTLHAALAHINKPGCRILTAEDPVEITHQGLRQLQVRPKIGLTFASAMRAFLRCDPDVIMVGEMRDSETARIGIEAALTGHLVFSTLHTNSAVETLTRLLDMGIDPLNFADGLLGIVAQRLVRTLCTECKEPYHPKKEEFHKLAREYNEAEFEHLQLSYTPELELHRAKGCSKCNYTGYYGRTAINEVLPGSDDIKLLIQQRRPTGEIYDQAKKQGMVTLKQDGVLKVFQGITDLSEVRKVCIK